MSTRGTVQHDQRGQHDATATAVEARRRCLPHGALHPVIVETCSCGARLATQCGYPVAVPPEAQA